MKHNFLFYFLAIMVTGTACHTPKIYTSPNFNTTKTRIKLLAILPFTVTVNKNRVPNGLKPDFLKRAKRMGGYKMQKSIYTWFARRRKEYYVDIQDVNHTNDLLLQHRISLEELQQMDKRELCRLLHVDGIITGSAELDKLMPDMGAEQVYDLTGFMGANNKASASLAIHDTNNELLWQLDYRTTGTSGNTTADMIGELMVKVSKRFPYKITMH